MVGYVDGSHFLMRKVVVGILILAGFYVVDGLIGKKLPTSFLPEEDYGYFFMNVQLPAAASLARTDQVLHKIEGMLSKTEGVKDYNTISGFSLLTRISASYQGFFFVSLKPWDERTSPQVTARAIVDRLNQELAAQVPEAVPFVYAAGHSRARQCGRVLVLAPGSQRWVGRLSRPEFAEVPRRMPPAS